MVGRTGDAVARHPTGSMTASRSTSNCRPTSENSTLPCGTHHSKGNCPCLGSASGPWGGVAPAPWARDSEGSEASCSDRCGSVCSDCCGPVCSDCCGSACSVSTGIAPPAPAAEAACSASATGPEPGWGPTPAWSPSDWPESSDEGCSFPDGSDEGCSFPRRAPSDVDCSREDGCSSEEDRPPEVRSCDRPLS